MIKLYSQRILSLATELPFTSPLTNPDISITKRSPVCGSTISIELKVSDNHISEFSQNVKACALGQATASIVANSIIGISFKLSSANKWIENIDPILEKVEINDIWGVGKQLTKFYQQNGFYKDKQLKIMSKKWKIAPFHHYQILNAQS